MSGRLRLLAGALGAIVLVALLWASLRALDQGPLPPAAPPKKVFTREIARDVSVRLRSTPDAESIRCRECRMEKRRMGAFSIGGMNTLHLRDLAVVLPSVGERRQHQRATDEGDRSGARSMLGEMGVSDSFLSGQGIHGRFSGLSIRGLSVSDYTNGCARPVFNAEHAELKTSGLALKGCYLVEGGRTNRLSKARLVRHHHGLVLKWRGGERRLR